MLPPQDLGFYIYVMVFCLGDLSVDVIVDRSCVFEEEQLRQLSHFATPGPGQFRVNLRHEFDQRQLLERTARAGATRVADSESVTIVATRSFSLEFDWSEQNVQVNVLQQLPQVFLSALNSAVSLIAVRSGGLALHSSSVGIGDEAVAFLGWSGRGKSTLAESLCPPCALIHDDFNLVFRRNEAFILCASPFSIRKSVPGSLAPRYLKNLYALRKGSDFRTEPCSRQQAIEAIVESSYHIAEVQSASIRILDAIGSIVAGLRLKFLWFDGSRPSAELIHPLFA